MTPIISRATIIFVAVNLIAMPASRAETEPTKWAANSGEWTDATRWSKGAPDPYKHVEVHGIGMVRVPPGVQARHEKIYCGGRWGFLNPRKPSI